MKLISQTELVERLGVGRTTVFRMMRDGRLPEPISVGRSKGWTTDQIDEFISTIQNSCSRKTTL